MRPFRSPDYGPRDAEIVRPGAGQEGAFRADDLPVILATGRLPEEELQRHPWLQLAATLLNPSP